MVGINLGLQNTNPAELDPQVKVETDQSKTVCLSCFHKHNSDGWAEICGNSQRETRANIIAKVLQITKLQSVDLWGLRVDSDRGKLTCFARVPADKATVLFDSRDTTIFCRPFVSKECPPTLEPGVAILWCNKIRDTNELTTIANTLKGVKGFTANAQSLGLRVETSAIAAARAAIQHPSPNIVQTNRHIAGSLRYITQGWPLSLSAPTIIACLASPPEDSSLKPWHVIPFRSQVQNGTRTWWLKADEEPSLDRIILPHGAKIALNKEPTVHEAFLRKVEVKKQISEAAKETRRANLYAKATGSGHSTEQPEDPWASWAQSRAKSAKTNKKATRPDQRQASPVDSQLRQDVDELKRQFATLNSKVTQNENRLDNLDRCMAANHLEVMTALRNLSVSSSSPSGEGRTKRSPELSSTSLKAIGGGRESKEAKKG